MILNKTAAGLMSWFWISINKTDEEATKSLISMTESEQRNEHIIIIIIIWQVI